MDTGIAMEEEDMDIAMEPRMELIWKIYWYPTMVKPQEWSGSRAIRPKMKMNWSAKFQRVLYQKVIKILISFFFFENII